MELKQRLQQEHFDYFFSLALTHSTQLSANIADAYSVEEKAATERQVINCLYAEVIMNN